VPAEWPVTVARLCRRSDPCRRRGEEGGEVGRGRRRRRLGVVEGRKKKGAYILGFGERRAL
jgi:hypothetical protein